MAGVVAARTSNISCFCGLDLAKPKIMGVINVTPDSFSDGGETFFLEDAVSRGRSMLAAGADILDIGGESTRPGALPVSVDEECGRVVPVIASLSQEGAMVSIDSRRAQVMAEAFSAGAAIVNDVSALTEDPDAIHLISQSGMSVVLSHMQGDPLNMQNNPTYTVASEEICEYLASRINICEVSGIPRAKIAVDPGIGFGKTLEHNLEILANIDTYHELNCALVIGVSRKSLIGQLTNIKVPSDRMPGSIAAALAARARGVQIFRVHDVAETRQAFEVWEAIEEIRI